MKTLGIIAARGGSKRFPKKNVRLFRGKPLIAWAIEAALNSGVVDRLVISTDSEEIAQISVKNGAEVPFMRPPELATDDAAGTDAILHAVEWVESNNWGIAQTVICLQATSPLVRASDVAELDRWALTVGANEVASFCRARTQPWQTWYCNERGFAKRQFIADRRDKESTAYELNGAIYWIRRDLLVADRELLTSHLRIYEMPVERSIDIDTELDFVIAEGVAEWLETQL